MLTLTLAFFVIALLYATVGFGGGSSYIAMLGMMGVAYTLIPKISLICNLLVVAGGCFHFIKNGHFNLRLILPFVLTSAPMAFLGGQFPLTEKTYFILLAVSLVLCGIRILFLPDRKVEEIKTPNLVTSLLTGTVLGTLSGLVGIGGGIFLSPILLNLGWARSKDAAAVASMFILVNSLAGLVGQFSKDPALPDLMTYAPLFIAVIIGGQIGSRIGTHEKISYALIQKGTGVLTLLISVRLLLKVL